MVAVMHDPVITPSPVKADTLTPITICAHTSAEALARVQEQLGEDAIVLGARSVRDEITGGKLVEVTATLPPEPPPIEVPESIARPSLLQMPKSSGAAPDNTGIAAALMEVLHEVRHLRTNVRTQGEALTAALSEIRTLRNGLDDIEAAVSNLTSEHTAIREHGLPAEWVPAYRRLIAGMVDAAIAEEIIREAAQAVGPHALTPMAINEQLISAVASRIATKPLFQQATPPKVLAVVGPGGCGKTTMLAKIAAQAALEGIDSVAIVATDAGGSYETLSRVAGAINAPIVCTPRGAGGLARAVAALQANGAEMVLVDTPALQIGEDEQIDGLYEELSQVEGTEILVVLPATMREVEMMRTTRSIARRGFDAFAFTHMDEALRTGGLLTVTESSGRPVAALSRGPSISEHFARPNAEAMANAMVRPPRANLRRNHALRGGSRTW